MIFIHLTYTPPKQYNSISFFFFSFIAHAKFEKKLIDESVFPQSIDFFFFFVINIYLLSHYNISHFHINANAEDIQDAFPVSVNELLMELYRRT